MPRSQAPRVVKRPEPTIQQRAWRSVLEVGTALMPLFDERFRAIGIDVQIYDVLLHTNEAGRDGIRMRELAERVLISTSGLTSLVDRIERRGLITRVPDPTDRRATRITLTPAGTTLFREAAKKHVADVEELFASRLSREEARQIHEVLSRIRAQLRG